MSPPPTRRILIQKGPNGLGFSVKGGGDVQLPLVVSRVESGGGAVGLLKVGMEISAVNGISLEGLPHYAAVEILRRTRSPVILFVRNSTKETVALADNYLLESDSRYNTLQSRQSTSDTIRSSYSKSEYTSNADLYDLRTVKRFVKEILHLPKEVFARKLAWKFPPVALGKFHKWLLSKLQRFDCEAPQNSANFIFDAFSQSLYLARAIYDLVHLIRTLMAMERTGLPATTKLPLQPAPGTQQPLVPLPHLHSHHAELHNPQSMAAFLAELSEIKSQLARAKEEGKDVIGTQAHISQQNAEIKALREQLMRYEAKISALSTSAPRSKDSDLGSFFKENFKRIKNKTLKRRQSLTGQNRSEGKVTIRGGGGVSIDEQSKENCPDNNVSRHTLEESRDDDVAIPRVDVVTSSPMLRREDKEDVEEDGAHNEIFVQMGEHVVAHSLQVGSDDNLAPPQRPRDRLYSSDDDYVQMNGVPSPGATLTRNFDPLKEEDPAIQRISRDYKRSSVSSSNSKVSIESLKLKHKQTIMIDSDECDQQDDSADYMTMDMNSSRQLVSDDQTQRNSYEDECEDYVEPDDMPAPRQGGRVEEGVRREGRREGKKDELCGGSDTISTGTLQADVNVTEERQIHATQVTEIGRDVDSIMVDVETLHRMERDLIKPAPPPLHPKPTLRRGTSPAVLPHPVITSPVLSHGGNGAMVRAHEVPIYAKVERVTSPPPPRIRPFSYGEASNSSYTSQNELSRHEVCTSSKTNPRKTSLTSNGSSVELKSDYSSDRPSSYNTSHTANSDHCDRSSRISSDVTPDENHRLSLTSDNKSDGVFNSPVKPTKTDPLSLPRNTTPAPDKPPRGMVAEKLHQTNSEPARTPSLSVSGRRALNSTGGLNVSFEVVEDLEDCKDKEVGEDFFNRGKKEKKPTPFKKILSFGKGKKKRSSSSGEQTQATMPRARQPEVRNMEGRVLLDDFKHSPHFSVERPSSRPDSLSSPLPFRRSRDNSGASSSSHSSGAASSSSHARQSTHSSCNSTDNQVADNSRNSASILSDSADISRNSASIYSGEFASPASSGPIGEVDAYPGIHNRDNFVNDNEFDVKSEHNSNSSIIYPGEAIPDNEISSENPRKSSKGFYDDLGVSINFDEIPVAKEPILDLTNETIIDLDGDIIKDQEELKILREKTFPRDHVILDNSFKNQNVSIMRAAENKDIIKSDCPAVKKNLERIMDSNLTAKVDSELRINMECSQMVEELERISSPPPLNKMKDNRVFESPSPTRMKKTPSPTFSEIDALLGNITADLDNLDF
ncbi:hypothetical protein ACHWQZ_G002689 [Mnemiopsis leidyi]